MSMKPIFLLLVAVVVTGGFAVGQTIPAQNTVVYSPSTTVVADELSHDESKRITYARGAVRIVSESLTMTADEADLHLLRSTRKAVDLDISLRGNVRVLVTPQNGGLR
jgi:lipopolysaccharide assembly outer membrane protein LptD (OstA)